MWFHERFGLNFMGGVCVEYNGQNGNKKDEQTGSESFGEDWSWSENEETTVNGNVNDANVSEETDAQQEMDTNSLEKGELS